MEDKNKHNFVYPLIVMIIALVLSYTLDLVYYLLANYAKSTFTFLPVVLVASVFPIGIAVLVVSTTWFALTKMQPRSFAQLIYLLVGLLFQVFLLLSIRTLPSIWFRGTIIETFLEVVFSHGLIPFFNIMTAVLMLLGVIGLIRNPQEKKADK